MARWPISVLAWRRRNIASWVGGVRADSISVFSYSSLSNCFVSFLELELEVIDYREGVDEVVAFVHA